MAEEEPAGEARDPDGVHVVVPAALSHEKVLRDHPELGPHLAEVLRAIGEPDHVAPDLTFDAATPLPPQRQSQSLAGGPKL